MEKELNEITPEIIEEQKKACLREVAMYKLHLAFKTKWWDKKYKEAKKKEDKETIAHHRDQDINPIQDKIDLKSEYYEYLCSLESSATAFADEENQNDTSEER